MFLIEVQYPSREEELAIARTTTGGAIAPLEQIISQSEVLAFRNWFVASPFQTTFTNLPLI